MLERPYDIYEIQQATDDELTYLVDHPKLFSDTTIDRARNELAYRAEKGKTYA